MSRGFTLVETVVGSLGAAIVLGGSVAAMTYAARAMEEGAIGPARQRVAAETAMTVLSDGRHAPMVDWVDAATIEMGLGESGSQTNAQLARYSWSGDAGDPIGVTLGAIDGRLGERTTLTDAERAALLAGASNTEERAGRAARAGVGVGGFRVMTRTRGGEPGGYAEETSTRFTITLELNSSGVSPTGTPRLPTPGTAFSTIALRMTSGDDRFASPGVISASLPEAFSVTQLGGGILVVRMSTPTTEAGSITIGLDVVDSWSFDYVIPDVVATGAEDGEEEEEEEDGGSAPTAVSATISGWRTATGFMN